MMELPPTPLKGLSLYNPWAWALFNAGKDVENRPWYSKFRGWAAIQVSMHWVMSEVHEVVSAIKSAAAQSGTVLPPIDLEQIKGQRGHIIGLVKIDDWKPSILYKSPWAFKEGYGAHVCLSVPIEPVLCKGSLGLFNLPSEVEQQVKEKFGRACVKLGLGSQTTGDSRCKS